MKLQKVFSQSSKIEIIMYLLICCTFLNILPSATLAKSEGKGIGINNPHANPHANLNIKPNANPRVNPAGIITGTGGTSVGSPATNQRGALISHEVTNVSTPKKHFVVKDGDSLFLGLTGSNVIVQIGSVVNPLNKAHPQGGNISLAAGDTFSNAIENLGSLAISLDVPDPIGAKGPNPTHGGQHPNKGDGNPGGGNGKGGWGQGNNGNGLGNIWTGNQGHGVGEGMACGSHNTPPEPPEPPQPPEPSPLPEPPQPPEPPQSQEPPVLPDPPPLYRETGIPPEEEEFENGGCPALMKLLATELGIEEQNLQISVDSAFISSTNIQACEVAAGLIKAAKTVGDANGTGVAAVKRVFNEFLMEGTPISEEQMTQIAAALAEHTDDGTYYAAAGQWLDAVVEYVSILINEMGFSADDAMAFVIDKYGATIDESESESLTSYIGARLSAI